jgi:hypothetical protein
MVEMVDEELPQSRVNYNNQYVLLDRHSLSPTGLELLLGLGLARPQVRYCTVQFRYWVDIWWGGGEGYIRQYCIDRYRTVESTSPALLKGGCCELNGLTLLSSIGWGSG